MPRSERSLLRPIPMAAIGAIAAAAFFGLGAGVAGSMAVVGLLAVAIISVVAAHPPAGAYLYLAAAPLIAGIARGQAIPVLRPNEALLALIGAGLALRGILALVNGRPFFPRLRRLDGAIAGLAFAGSVLPLLWRYAASEPISGDDIFYAAVFVKYLLLYAVFRLAVRTPQQLHVALWTAMGATAIVALVAVLQALSLAGVPEFLQAYYTPFQGETADIGRGSSTLALSFGVADIMAIGLGIAAGFMRGASRREQQALVAFGAVFVLGAVAAGQFSGFLGLLVAVVAIGIGLRNWRAAQFGLGAAVVAGLLLWPVVEGRIAGFSGGGVPQSWTGRFNNIRDFILPELTDGLHWLRGVRPAARIPAPEIWREWVYIESGYLWLLWTGGLIMVIAFGYLMYVGLRTASRAIQRGPRPITAAGLGAFVGLSVILVLTLFDPHLTMRGTADLLFPLMAMTLVGAGERAPDRTTSFRATGMVRST